MRKIDSIFIHCSDTPKGRNDKMEDVRRWHKERGWTDIGYHYVIELDGTVKKGRSIEKSGAHAKGYNSTSIGICYIGGKGGDTRTKEQKGAMTKLVFELKVKYGVDNKNIKGHNEVSSKKCPSFNVREWVDDMNWN